MGGTPPQSQGAVEGLVGMNSNYSDDFKDTMIRKLTGPGARSATALAEEVGIRQSPLSRWLRERGRFAATGGGVSGKKNQSIGLRRRNCRRCSRTTD